MLINRQWLDDENLNYLLQLIRGYKKLHGIDCINIFSNQNINYIRIYYFIMNTILRNSKKFISKLDLFPAMQFLRYKQEEEYRTLTGGLVSATLIVIFVIIFYSLGVQTANKEIINSSVTYESKIQPQRIDFSFKEGSDFMFAIGIQGMNLSDPTIKYFNVVLSQNVIEIAYDSFNLTFISLVQCTESHFSYNSDTLKFYNDFKVSAMLCPPLDQNLFLGGRLISKVFEQFSIYVSYCNRTVDPICANDSQMLDFQSSRAFFSIMVPIVNTLVNPGEKEYKSVYIEDRNYYFFTTTSGLQINAQIQQYQIDTDASLMPWTNIVSQYIMAIPDLMQVKTKPIYKNLYVQVKFCKSSLSTTFKRSFNKIDDYFSYVGGLVGSVLILFFILKSYSEKSYLVSIASQVYSVSATSQSGFNFLYFISVNLQKVFAMCGAKPKWQQSTKFLQAMEEMEKQLSVDFLLRKIEYFQEAINSLLSEHQIKLLLSKERKSIETVTKERKKRFPQRRWPNSTKIKNIIFIENAHEIPKQNNLSKHSFGEMLPEEGSAEEVNYSEPQSRKEEKQHQFKTSLNHVIRDSLEGNIVSRRILEKVTKNTYPQIHSSMKSQNSQSKKKQNFDISKSLDLKQNDDNNFGFDQIKE